VQSKVHKSCCFDYHYQSSSLNPLLVSLNPSLAICMTIILSIIHLHLRCHLVQSFSEFGVVLPISHCTWSWRLDVPSRKIVEPWKRVHLPLASSLLCCRGDIQVIAFANSPSVLANFPLISNHLIASSIFPCCRQS
jgi:hypothetical protein